MWIKPKEYFKGWAMDLVESELENVHVLIEGKEKTYGLQLPGVIAREIYNNVGYMNVRKGGGLYEKPFWRATYHSE